MISTLILRARHKLFLVQELKFETNDALYPSGIALLKEAVTYLRKRNETFKIQDSLFNYSRHQEQCIDILLIIFFLLFTAPSCTAHLRAESIADIKFGRTNDRQKRKGQRTRLSVMKHKIAKTKRQRRFREDMPVGLNITGIISREEGWGNNKRRICIGRMKGQVIF